MGGRRRIAPWAAAALEDLEHQRTTRAKQDRETRRDGLEKGLLVGPVHRANAGELGRRIREHDIGRPPQGSENLIDHRRLADVPDQGDDVGVLEGRIDGRAIHAHDAPGRAHRGRGHLQPSPRPASDIEHTLTRSQQTLGPLDLDQFVGRARAIAFALRALVEVVLAFVPSHVPFLRVDIRRPEDPDQLGGVASRLS
jgi:hypothetical protein